MPENSIKQLAVSKRWRALLHINAGSTLRDRNRSYVDDTEFFLAADGKQNALAELLASLKALKPAASLERCRFPARYRFLAERLGWTEKRPLAHCEKYLAWRAEVPTGQLVLVFPTAYLNSPSSMFGHTLLRLDAQRNPDSTWLSLAINFGATTNTGDNSFMYAWRGLAGGYPGHFSTVAYAKKIQDYSRVENRDIWEYALNLSPDELDWLARHLWELKDVNFDYFFLDENCSFRLLELIQVARPDASLLEGLRFAEVPVKTVRTLSRAGMIADKRYRPSKASELAYFSSQLSPEEITIARALRDDAATAKLAAYQQLATTRQRLVAQTAYQALRLDHRKGKRDAAVARRSLALLRLIESADVSTPPTEVPQPLPPEAGHDTQALTMDAGVDDGEGFTELGYRLTYHDLLDPPQGFLPGTAIEGLDLRLRATQDQGVKLERLDLVDIRSLTPWGPFSRPISWFVSGGLERGLVDEDDRQLLLYLQGGPGLSWRSGAWLPYLMGIARIENLSFTDSGLEYGTGAEAGVLRYGKRIQWGLTSRAVYFDGGGYRVRQRLQVSRSLGRNTALRAHCEYNDSRSRGHSVCGLGARYFYD